eukprot:RCo032039
MALALADAVVEFLEVATHHILCCWKVYPVEIFERRSKYRTWAYISRHAGLNEYIAQQLLGLRGWIAEGILRRFSLLLKDESGFVWERIVFQMELPRPPSAVPPEELRGAFRGFLLQAWA